MKFRLFSCCIILLLLGLSWPFEIAPARGALSVPQHPSLAQMIYFPLIQSNLPSVFQTVFNPVEDSFVSSANPNNNYGNLLLVYAGYDDSQQKMGILRGLIRFNLINVPRGVRITAATLTLFYNDYRDTVGTTRTITVHRAIGSWSEKAVTWGNAPAIGEAYGSVNILATNDWQYVSIDITDLVKGWANGVWPNNGLYLIGPESTSDWAYRGFETRENIYKPLLGLSY